MKMVLPVDGYRSTMEFMAAMQGSEGDTHWLMKQTEHWHGGIHLYDSFAGNAVFKPGSHGLKCYQLSSSLGVVRKYILQSKYKDNFVGLNIGTDAFNKEWKKIAEEDENNFSLDQHQFIKKTHYDVQLSFLAKHGVKINHKRAAIHDMIWSTSVQYGPYTGLIIKAVKDLSFDDATDTQIISAVQDYKYNHVETHFRSSPSQWSGLKARASSEKATLLLLIKDNVEIE